MGRKKKLIQSKVKNVKFQFDQYWSIKYIEVDPNSKQSDYKVIIKARSSDLARSILKIKCKETNPHCKIKGVSINMLHSNSTINGLRLTLKDWECVKESSFPNSVNVLFRFNSERSERHKKHLKNLRQNHPKVSVKYSGQNLSQKQKNHMKWDGKWKPWPKVEREALKEKIFIGLKLNNNCRLKAAKYVSVSQRYFQKLLKKFPEVDWAKEFPVQRYKFSSEDNSKRLEKLRESKLKSKEAFLQEMSPKVISLLDQGCSYVSICKSLKTSKITINNCIQYHEHKK
tara:strand:+ start:4876 stop:5730 length:855 start_codon:yes stop_codon:yes gene_type:complete